MGVAVLAASGSALVLGELHWFRRARWVERIGPYLPGAPRARRPAAVMSRASLREVVVPAGRPAPATDSADCSAPARS